MPVCLLAPQASRDSSAFLACCNVTFNMWHPFGQVLWSSAKPGPECDMLILPSEVGKLSGRGTVREGFREGGMSRVLEADSRRKRLEKKFQGHSFHRLGPGHYTSGA